MDPRPSLGYRGRGGRRQDWIRPTAKGNWTKEGVIFPTEGLNPSVPPADVRVSLHVRMLYSSS